MSCSENENSIEHSEKISSEFELHYAIALYDWTMSDTKSFIELHNFVLEIKHLANATPTISQMISPDQSEASTITALTSGTWRFVSKYRVKEL